MYALKTAGLLDKPLDSKVKELFTQHNINTIDLLIYSDYGQLRHALDKVDFIIYPSLDIQDFKSLSAQDTKIYFIVLLAKFLGIPTFKMNSKLPLKLENFLNQQNSQPMRLQNYHENYFRYSGISMHYITTGQRSNPPLLFLHGIGGRALSYQYLLRFLSKSFWVIAPDLPYFGKSDTPKEVWHFLDFSTYLSEFIKFLRLFDNTYVLAGHSFGGALATNLILTQNIQPKHVILFNPAGEKINVDKTILMYRFWITKTINDKKLYSDKDTLPKVALDFTTNLLKNINKFEDLQKINKIVDYLLQGDPQLLHKRLHIPTSIYWTKQEEIFKPAYQIKYATHFKCAETFILKGGHDWLVFNSGVEEFKNNLPEGYPLFNNVITP